MLDAIVNNWKMLLQGTGETLYMTMISSPVRLSHRACRWGAPYCHRPGRYPPPSRAEYGFGGGLSISAVPSRSSS